VDELGNRQWLKLSFWHPFGDCQRGQELKTGATWPGRSRLHSLREYERWLAGRGSRKREALATHDGSNSWQEVPLKSPPGAYPATEPTYDLPVFRDSNHGFLPVTYSGPEGTGLALVLFATNDGGRSWNPDRMLLRLPEIYAGVAPPSAVADSALIAATAADHVLTFRTAESGIGINGSREPAAKANKLPNVTAVQGLSFTDEMRGWILTGDQLLSTSDGGTNWTDVTPSALRRMRLPATTVKVPSGDSSNPLSNRPVALSYPLPSSADLSIHLGFDQCPGCNR